MHRFDYFYDTKPPLVLNFSLERVNALGLENPFPVFFWIPWKIRLMIYTFLLACATFFSGVISFYLYWAGNIRNKIVDCLIKLRNIIEETCQSVSVIYYEA